ncbi:MAG: hypothetical protein ABFE07_28365 [Armatimonadia bacterium]
MEPKPDFVNAQGVKWWRQGLLNSYLREKGAPENLSGWVAERPDGVRSYLVIDGQGVLLDDQNLETIGGKIDILAMKGWRL